MGRINSERYVSHSGGSVVLDGWLGNKETPSHMTSLSDQYDSDYYLRGKQSGKSLYENYRWLPDLTKPMAETIANHLGIELTDRILDFGCARGYLVKAFMELGFTEVYGIDVSQWAIANCDPEVRKRVAVASPVTHNLIGHDWIIAKDVLEHIPEKILTEQIAGLASSARKGVFIVVPLANGEFSKYIVPEYEQDVTHVIRWPLWRWVQECHLIFDESWEISARYRIKGIKDNYSQFARGNGFITIRRIT